MAATASGTSDRSANAGSIPALQTAANDDWNITSAQTTGSGEQSPKVAQLPRSGSERAADRSNQVTSKHRQVRGSG
jgi:hypothetical protein